MKRLASSLRGHAKGALDAYGFKMCKRPLAVHTAASFFRFASTNATNSSSLGPTGRGSYNGSHIYKNVYQSGFSKGVVDRNIQAYLQSLSRNNKDDQAKEVLGGEELRRLFINIKNASDRKLVEKILVHIKDNYIDLLSPKNTTLMLMNCKIHKLTSLSQDIYKELLSLDTYDANIVHLTVLLQTLSTHGRHAETYKMCQDIYTNTRYDNIKGDPILTSTAFTAMSAIPKDVYAAKTEMLDFVVDIFDNYLKSGRLPSPGMVSALLLVCGKCKNYKLAESILDKLINEHGVVANVGIFNSLMVASNMNKDYNRTLEISNKMSEMNIEPNFRSTMTKVIAYAGLGKEEEALDLYYNTIKSSPRTDSFEWNGFRQVLNIMHKSVGGAADKDIVSLSKTSHSIIRYAIDRLLNLRLKNDKIPRDIPARVAFYIVISGKVDRMFNVITGDGHSTVPDDGSEGTLEHFTRNAGMWISVFNTLRYYGLTANASSLAQRLRAHYMGWPLDAAMKVRVASVDCLSHCGRSDIASGIIEEGLNDFVVCFNRSKEEFIHLYLHYSVSTYEPEPATRLVMELLGSLKGSGDDASMQHLLESLDAPQVASQIDKSRLQEMLGKRSEGLK